MEISILPAAFESDVLLDGVGYRLEFRYVSHVAMWLVRLYTADGELIVSKFAEIDQPLLGDCRSPRRPRGELWCVNSPARATVDHADFSVRTRLVYISRAEIEQFATSIAAA